MDKGKWLNYIACAFMGMAVVHFHEYRSPETRFENLESAFLLIVTAIVLNIIVAIRKDKAKGE